MKKATRRLIANVIDSLLEMLARYLAHRMGIDTPPPPPPPAGPPSRGACCALFYDSEDSRAQPRACTLPINHPLPHTGPLVFAPADSPTVPNQYPSKDALADIVLTINRIAESQEELARLARLQLYCSTCNAFGHHIAECKVIPTPPAPPPEPVTFGVSRGCGAYYYDHDGAPCRICTLAIDHPLPHIGPHLLPREDK